MILSRILPVALAAFVMFFATIESTAADTAADIDQKFSENEIVRFHEMCRGGDHDSCVRRDAAIHDHDHEAEWRHSHPEWYR